MVAAGFGKLKSPGKKKTPLAPQFLEKPEFSYHDLKQRGTTPGPSHPELRGRGMMEETGPQNINSTSKLAVKRYAAAKNRKKLMTDFDSSVKKATGGMKKANKPMRSDTGGTIKVLKGSLDPSKHDSSRLKYFSK